MSSEQSHDPQDGEAMPAKKPFPWIDILADRLAATSITWARQSLSMGKRVLETSAKMLSQTAESLDEWAKNLDRPKRGPAEPPAPSA